ncbi:MAG: putative Ig domain-containing protein [Fretibacterium sp.]|nr:putative Ig domain-containing protein [Fretibacterium sp.]
MRKKILATLLLSLCLCGTAGAATFTALKSKLEAGGNITLTENYTYDSASDSGATSIEITKETHITGSVTIDGGGAAGPILKFTTGSAGSSVEGITFTNAKSAPSSTANGGGAAIYIDKVKVTVSNCTFTGNAVESTSSKYAGGAGIYNNASDGTEIDNCVFKKNTVKEKTKGGYNGGAAIFNYNVNNLIVKGCTFEENSSDIADGDGGGAMVNGAYGGSTSNGIKVTDCVFKKNSIGGHVSSNGGAIINVAANDNSSLEVMLKGCTFEENLAPRYGGAVFNNPESSTSGNMVTIDVEDCQFLNNILSRDDGNGSFGGGMANFAGRSGKLKVTVKDSLFKGNKIVNNGMYNPDIYWGCAGGGLGSCTNNSGQDASFLTKTLVSTDIIGCRFEENEANYGGGLYNNGSVGTATMTVTDCTFVGNIAKSSAFYSATSTPQGFPRGGGIFNRGESSPTVQGGIADLTVTNCTFTANEADYGGAMGNRQNVGGTATSTAVNCSFIGNVVGTSDTGAEVYNASGTMNLINNLLWNSGSTYIYNDAAATLTLTNSAYTSDATTLTGTDCVTLASDWGASHKAEDVTSGDITHTVFKLTAADTDLIGKGTATASDVTLPATDQLGVKRKNPPDIGATEFLTLSISTTSLPRGTLSEDYEAVLEATKDAEISDSITWSLKDGDSLPDGLELDKTTGKITGTPTAVGTTKFNAVATAGSHTASADLSITVLPAFAPLSITLTEGTDNVQTSTVAQATAAEALTALGGKTLSTLAYADVSALDPATAIDFSGEAAGAAVAVSITPDGIAKVFDAEGSVVTGLSVPATSEKKTVYRLAALNRATEPTHFYVVEIRVYAPAETPVEEGNTLDLGGEGEDAVEIVKMEDQPTLTGTYATEETFVNSPAYASLGLTGNKANAPVIFTTSKDVSYPTVEQEDLEDVYEDISADLAAGGAATKSGKKESLLAVFVPFRPVNTGVHVMGLDKSKFGGLKKGQRPHLYVRPWTAFDAMVLNNAASLAADTGSEATLLDAQGNVVTEYDGTSELNAAAYLEGGTVYNQYITVEAAADEPDSPTSNRGSGGCDALTGGLALLFLVPLFARKSR